MSYSTTKNVDSEEAVRVRGSLTLILSWRLIEYFGLPYNRKSSPPYREVSSTLRYRPLLITQERVLITRLLASTTLHSTPDSRIIDNTQRLWDFLSLL